MTKEKIMKYSFWFAIVCLIMSPWITVVWGEWGNGVTLVGLFVIVTYSEFLPRFHGSFLKTLSGIIAILGVIILEIIYSIIVSAIAIPSC
ncbi:hypothetical protein NVV78_08110 [Pediococcus ethanolidurans]|uniref:hypothetical protein n=1 Tax=Pediococcus ethanolidurans TaxID=319653 RepID=UPI0021E78754|nr:hypothetical protein [Pediococcus ethanolidurans]MCV3315903.1 hypothetical protein [Pediococcus ethanolidurans]